MKLISCWMALVAASLLGAGCDGAASVQQSAAPQSATQRAEAGVEAVAEKPAAPAAPVPRIPTPLLQITAEQLHERLRAVNPGYNQGGQFRIEDGRLVAAELRQSGVKDITPLRGQPIVELDLAQTAVVDLGPLKGMPIERLFLEETGVKDLGALKGMPLKELYLSRTEVSDLSALSGSPLEEINLIHTPVKDLSPLKDSPLRMLWASYTPVEDLAGLAGTPLESVTLESTRVRGVAWARDLPRLQRMHIADTPVTDLRPLEGLALTRLIFTPGRIKQGIDEVRRLATMREIGVTLDGKMEPIPFWENYDKGAFR